MFRGEHKQTDIAQSAIFTTGSIPASRLYPVLLATFLLMYGDYAYDLSSKIRVFSSYVFTPFTELSFLAKDSLDRIDSYFSSQKKLSEEIQFLKKKIRDLETTNIILQNTKYSLNELEELFELSKSFGQKEIFFGKINDYKKFPDEVLTVSIRTNEITKDMIAFNAFGMVGLIDELQSNLAKIKPLHFEKNQIPAKNIRTLENMILVGTGQSKSFFVEEFKKNSDISLGDEIISSGLGGKFPEGFSLGKVSEIYENEESNFLVVKVRNTYDFSYGSTILFTKP